MKPHSFLGKGEYNIELYGVPKTNWASDDAFNIGDFNRIKNNLLVLENYIGGQNTWYDLGDDITSTEGTWNPTYFTNIERNLSKMNGKVTVDNSFSSRTYYAGGPFIKYDRLNQIEQDTLALRDALSVKRSNGSILGVALGLDMGIGDL